MYQINMIGLPAPEREYRFNSNRRWRFDFAWVDKKLAVECEGGIYTQGRHNRPLGFEGDCEKYNMAALEGWKVLRFTGKMIYSGEAINVIEKALEKSNEQESVLDCGEG